MCQYRIYSNYRTHGKGLITEEKTFISVCPLNVTVLVVSSRYIPILKMLNLDGFLPKANPMDRLTYISMQNLHSFNCNNYHLGLTDQMFYTQS